MKLIDTAPTVFSPTGQAYDTVGLLTDKIFAINGLVLVKSLEHPHYFLCDPETPSLIPVGKPGRKADGKTLRTEAIRVGYNYRRMQCLKRDRYCCLKCASRRNLEVHHRSPRSKGRNDKLENLITLCNTCHGKEHGR